MRMRLLTVALAALFLAACATVPPQQAYDRSTRQQVKRIAILTPGMDDNVEVRLMVHPGQSFGLIGALIAEGSMSGKSSGLTDALRSQGFDHRARFLQAVSDSLKAQGYEVSIKQVSRDPKAFEFLKTYPAASGTDEAYLDLYSGLVGYTAAGATTPYRPTMFVGVRLVEASKHQVLFQDQILYNPFGDQKNAITLAPDAAYDFADYDLLMADPKKAIAGLQLALDGVATALAQQLD